MKRKVKVWLHGLIGGAVGGGANALVSTFGIAGAESLGVPIKSLDPKQAAVMFVIGFVMSAALYLKQSPLPPLNGDTDFINK